MAPKPTRCGRIHVRKKPCTECKRLYDIEYRERTSDYQIKTHKKYVSENWDSLYEAHKKRLENPNIKRKVLEAFKKWQRSNLDYFRQYAKEHPEHSQAKCSRRRARLKNAEGSFTAKEWLTIVSQQENKCAVSGIECKLTVAHIVPLSKGGNNWVTNIQGLCVSCNSSKGNRDVNNL